MKLASGDRWGMLSSSHMVRSIECYIYVASCGGQGPGQVALSNEHTAAHALISSALLLANRQGRRRTCVRPSQKWASQRPGCASQTRHARSSSTVLHMCRARSAVWRGVASSMHGGRPPAGRLHAWPLPVPYRQAAQSGSSRGPGERGDRRGRACAGAGRPAGPPGPTMND